MSVPHNIRDIRMKYQTLINRGFDCVCEHDILRAFATKSRIEQLLRILVHEERTNEFITMEINLLQMKESLTLLINLHLL